ncbi:Rhamnogalacturonan acetylesterase RhgT [Fulvia fulva]|uniref:Rhamnogalacturonan acetylesterase RhgT n=1 Tax=Passalora fulva TaxID=5499 RepID=A0A9Q8LK23_PASFU|nr:Rhamnogalacturonan acetylesterase RhgT [Fulvia fulva]KAK4623819.1 Rhamnogalacturonan acetylesterase RhgT [Fulvia fulva]KAK4625811.1 Rhamnogalacturonan acetylesterase RhgT [Fulvia fulva]UJO18143.1 Rhamnogalacturonan acetylesterase RhgT [Fulvia fulva]WPV15463.1 Rhamnogalacturonan acetylesterase RhgT [Fulvia fulva]WPV30007.1 Rhamnogalacturonan acetylesterase RhgT [Fulvia fulva]
MRTSAVICAAISASTTYAAAIASRSALPPFFLVAGDSTTAKGGGWGDGFLETTLSSPASGINYGHSGTTTVSFRALGDWDTVLEEAEGHKYAYDVFVTIQFGHNDQKPAANISLSQFAANLATFVDEVRSVGAEPILISSLTRRTFSGDPPRVIENLANERNATISVALERETKWIDLNKASTDYVNAIGPDASHVYNLAPDDNTHLNDWGSVVFGRMVSDLLVEKYGDVFEQWTVENQTLSEAIEAGLPA